MNRTLLLEHADRFSDVLFSLLNWELENHYDPTPFPGVTGYYDYESEIESWKFHLTITGLNRRWKHFIEDVGLDENDTVFCVEHLLNDLKYHILPKLTKRLEKYKDHPKLKKLIRPASGPFKERELILGRYQLYDTINEFQNFFTNELEEIKKQKIRNEVLVNHSNKQSPILEPVKENSLDGITTGLSWENQTELAELIYVLEKSKKVLKNGKPIQVNELTEIFNKLFDTKIKTPTGLLNPSAKTFKKGEDGKTFMSELNTHIEKYIKDTLDKEQKKVS